MLNCIFFTSNIQFHPYRFLAICYPMKVKSICTTRRAKIVIPIPWIISATNGLPPIFLTVREQQQLPKIHQLSPLNATKTQIM